MGDKVLGEAFLLGVQRYGGNIILCLWRLRSVWIKRFSYLVLYSHFVLQPDVLRIPRDILQGLTHLVGLVVTLMLVIFVLQNRETVASWLRGCQPSRTGRVHGAFVTMRGFIASIWHLLAIAFLVGTLLSRSQIRVRF